MKIKITINCDNEAFQNNTGGELHRILTELAQKTLLEQPKNQSLFDINGNKVGIMEVKH